MKRHTKKLLLLGLLVLHTSAQAQELYGSSFFSTRSQSTNLARNLVNTHRFTNLHDKKNNWYGNYFSAIQFMQSYDPERVAESFFATDTIHVTGSQVANRTVNDVLADYFGLSPSFDSFVQFVPRVRNTIIDNSLYVGCNKWFFNINAPLVWTHARVGIKETINNNGTDTQYPAEYMTVNALTAPLTNFETWLKGETTFGDVQEALQFGKINGTQEEFALSDVHLVAGYNLVARKNGHAGFSLRAAIPTGSRPNGEYMFEPVVGNGKHWELGAGFSGQVLIWEKGGEQKVNFSFDINITHLFAARQKRSFDLCSNGFGSRFILAKEFDNTGAYTRKTVPTINKTTLECNVSNSLQADFAIMFAYTKGKFNFDIGYNGWVRSKDNITITECLPENTYGLKGIQDVVLLGNPSSATQSNATLNGNSFADQNTVVDTVSPVFFNTQDLDPKSAATPQIETHKIFTFIGYSWIDKQHAIPFVGIGGEVEFEGVRPERETKANKNALAQWGIMVKGGLAF